MRVKKRDGKNQLVDFNKISNRIKYMVDGIDSNGEKIGDQLDIDPNEIAKEVCGLIIDGITTSELDEFAAEHCAYRVGQHYHYDVLASRIIVSNHHKNTIKNVNFSDMMEALYNNKDKDGKQAPLISTAFYNAVMSNQKKLDDVVNKNHNRDYANLDYFGFKTLEKGYLLKVKNDSNHIQERYQHLLMREAFAMYEDDIDLAIEYYELLSKSLFTHASPTLFNSGTARPQLSSCYLVGVHDSIDGMYECTRRLAHISKWAGGIGVWLHKIRSSGSMIRGTNGESSGILPYLKVLNDEARHVNQGGKRKGSIAVYLEPWHGDIFDFLDMKKNQGAEELRARDLFFALYVCDLFMKRIEKALSLKRTTGSHDVKWSLMCPDSCPRLADCYGQEFEDLYVKYESEGRFIKQVDILKLWQAILDSQKENGGPYMLYKDSINHKSNQKNVGIIRSSNLCAEIVEYSDHNEYGVCNLNSLNLKKMIKLDDKGNPSFDYDLLHYCAKKVTRGLNRVIDRNYYPIPETKRSNFRHRPTGIGVQGLADVFILLRYPFESPEAQKLNREISETIYHGAIEASCELAKERYEKLSKLSDEELQELKHRSSFIDYHENYLENLDRLEKTDLTSAERLMKDDFIDKLETHKILINEIIEKYGLDKQVAEYQYMNLDRKEYLGAYSTFVGSPAYHGQLQYDLWEVQPSSRWNFTQLKQQINKYGLRNSLLIALMPTATTAQILGSNECTEPITSNIYARQVLSGTFIVVNKYLQRDLTALGLWNQTMKDKILTNKGSIQDIEEIPDNLKQLYKTAWEMSKKTLIDMMISRGPFVDQSQSHNSFISDPNDNILTSSHLYAWKQGAKTGMYYLRRETLVDPQRFTVDIKKHLGKKEPSTLKTSSTGPECVSCGS